MNLETSNCRSCEAPIVWCRMRSGKTMPVDADPTPRGDFYLVTADDGTIEAHHVRTHPEKLGEDVDRYTSHFATCDNPERFRR